MEIPEVHNQDVSSEGTRKIPSALFDEELHDEQEEYDVHPKHHPPVFRAKFKEVKDDQ